MHSLIPIGAERFVKPVSASCANHRAQTRMQGVRSPRAYSRARPRGSRGVFRCDDTAGQAPAIALGISKPSSRRIDTRAISGRPVIAVWSSDSILSNSAIPARLDLVAAGAVERLVGRDVALDLAAVRAGASAAWSRRCGEKIRAPLDHDHRRDQLVRLAGQRHQLLDRTLRPSPACRRSGLETTEPDRSR